MITAPQGNLDYSKVGEGYANQDELLRDWFYMLDYRLYLLYRYHVWLGPENHLQGMLGLVISREEFEQKLLGSARINGFEAASESERTELLMIDRLVGNRLGKTNCTIPCLRLVESCGLDAFGWRCVLLAFSARLDAKYGVLFAYLQDDVTKKFPTVDLACQLFAQPNRPTLNNRHRFADHGSLCALFEPDAWERGELVLLPSVEAFLLHQTPPLPDGFRIAEPNPDTPPPVRRALAQQIRSRATNGTVLILRGAQGIGKRFMAQSVADEISDGCLLADLERLPEEAGERVRVAILLSSLLSLTPCFYHFEALTPQQQTQAEDALSEMRGDGHPIILCTENDYHAEGLADRFVLLVYEVPPLEDAERSALFQGFLPRKLLEEGVSLRELAVKFRFTPLQIVKAARQAMGSIRPDSSDKISAEELHRCCYAQATHQLNQLATPVTPVYDWDDLILPLPQLHLMRQACAYIQYSYPVYNEWGFSRKVQYGRGLSMLFSGPPGTGKTMAAQVIAKQLHMELYKIQLSQLVSKYIGETEKNLRTVFQEARKSGGILFFDECDALFGKRSDVKDSHDRHANMETAYLLQQVEEYEGVTIMATNLLQNIDAAFMRRISFVIRFPFPDKVMRERLFRGMLPDKAPIASDIDFPFLASHFEFSGGSIKNIVLSAAFLAAAQDCSIGMAQLVSAAVNELKKNDIVVAREDLREYQDLVEW